VALVPELLVELTAHEFGELVCHLREIHVLVECVQLQDLHPFIFEFVLHGLGTGGLASAWSSADHHNCFLVVLFSLTDAILDFF